MELLAASDKFCEFLSPGTPTAFGTRVAHRTPFDSNRAVISKPRVFFRFIRWRAQMSNAQYM